MGCTRFARVLALLLLTAPPTLADDAADDDSAPTEFRCGECLAMQEAIQRSIVNNITDISKKAIGGTTQTATVEVGQIIWHLCGSDAWTEQRYAPSLTKTCRREVRKHVDLMTNYWKEKTAEEYQDVAIALRMKRAVCPNQDVGACLLESLPSDFEPLKPDECAVCRALASDIFGIVRLSRDRPTKGSSDMYFRVVAQMGTACEDMPMRHAMRPKQRQDVKELCEDLWDEHEATFTKMAIERSSEFAASICSEQLELCEDATSLEELYQHDPTGGKDEL